MIQACSSFNRAGVCIINTRPDEIASQAQCLDLIGKEFKTFWQFSLLHESSTIANRYYPV